MDEENSETNTDVTRSDIPPTVDKVSPVAPKNDDSESSGTVVKKGENDGQIDCLKLEDKSDKGIESNAGEDLASAGSSGLPSWNHVNRKVLIQGVLKFNNAQAMKKDLSRWIEDIRKSSEGKVTLEYDKIKKPPKEKWMVVTMKDESMVQPLIEYINTKKITTKRGHELFAKLVDDNTYDQMDRGEKRTFDSSNDNDIDDTNNNNNNNPTSKRARTENIKHINPHRRPVTADEIRNKIVPLWKLTPAEQAKTKVKLMIKQCTMKIVSEVKNKICILNKDRNREKIDIFPWLSAKGCIHMNPIISAPTPLRNKSEFTFGYRYLFDNDDSGINKDTNVADKNNDDTGVKITSAVKTSTGTSTIISTNMDTTNDGEQNGINVSTPTKMQTEVNALPKFVPGCGFLVTGWSGGISRPHDCAVVPPEHCAIVDLLDNFVQNTSLLPVYDAKLHQGFWRLVTIRSSRRTRECMIIIQHSSPFTGGVGDKAISNNSTSCNDNEKSTSNVDSGLFSKRFDVERKVLIELLTSATLSTEHPTDESVITTSTTTTTPTTTTTSTTTVGGGDNDQMNSSDDVVPKSLKVTSIFFQEFTGVSSPPPEHPVQHAYGKRFLTEKLGKCTFQISPGAFFQVNTEGAELLYQLVVDKVRDVTFSSSDEKGGDVSDDPSNSLLFDVCCGTGTIGLTCMKEGVVGHVVGVDISEPAILDAKMNAILNGFGGDGTSSSCGTDDEVTDLTVPCTTSVTTAALNTAQTTIGTTRFVAARAEQVLEREIRAATKGDDGRHTTSNSTSVDGKRIKKFVAVVDPAREGLHTDVVRSIRSSERITRLVYVSCNPTGSLVNDAALLCAPPTKRYSGKPFKITSATPVDMFPLTNHCEMVMTFDRID